jgi:hypothetical protein
MELAGTSSYTAGVKRCADTVMEPENNNKSNKDEQ